jgi:hypothetical protein
MWVNGALPMRIILLPSRSSRRAGQAHWHEEITA